MSVNFYLKIPFCVFSRLSGFATLFIAQKLWTACSRATVFHWGKTSDCVVVLFVIRVCWHVNLFFNKSIQYTMRQQFLVPLTALIFHFWKGDWGHFYYGAYSRLQIAWYGTKINQNTIHKEWMSEWSLALYVSITRDWFVCVFANCSVCSQFNFLANQWLILMPT